MADEITCTASVNGGNGTIQLLDGTNIVSPLRPFPPPSTEVTVKYNWYEGGEVWFKVYPDPGYEPDPDPDKSKWIVQYDDGDQKKILTINGDNRFLVSGDWNSTAVVEFKNITYDIHISCDAAYAGSISAVADDVQMTVVDGVIDTKVNWGSKVLITFTPKPGYCVDIWRDYQQPVQTGGFQFWLYPVTDNHVIQVITAAIGTAPGLVSPPEGSTLFGQIPFRWSTVAGATQYYLEIQDDRRAIILPVEDPWWDRDTRTTTATDVTVDLGPPVIIPFNGRWRVRASSPTGIGTSDWRNFTFKYFAPGLVSPPEGSTLSGPTEFSWSTIAGATQYKLEIQDDAAAFGATIDPWRTKHDLATTATKVTVDLGPPMPFRVDGRWRVLASSPTIGQGVSDWRNFIFKYEAPSK